MSLDNSPAYFFSANVVGTSLSSSTYQESTDSFARAIESRFETTSVSPLTARLLNPPSSSRTTTPPILSLSLTPRTPMASVSPPSVRAPSRHPNTSNTTSYNLSPQIPADLDSFINDPGCLILDIRHHAAFTSARLPRALSLSVPSTLLKRPLFSLTKLSQMLPCKSSRLRFSAWSTASTILVYDAESSSISDGSNIQGLLQKFRNEGFSADKKLAWLKGGFVSIWRERPDLVVSGPENVDEYDEEGDQDAPSHLSLSVRMAPTVLPPFVLRTKNLPMSAFTSTSTTSQLPTSMGSHYSPVRLTSTSSSVSTSSRPSLPHPTPEPVASLPSQQTSIAQPLTMPFNPFYDTVRQNMELSQGITERIPLTLPKNVRSRINDLPLPWLRHMARRAAPAAKDYSSPLEPQLSDNQSDDPSTSDSDGLPDTDTLSSKALVEEGAEAFAMQFYRIELGEQRRLMGIMQHHSQESGHIINSSPSPTSEGKQVDMLRARVSKSTPRSPLFPYSITAGIEKGAKNRYRNIWPFEHARVRLHKHSLSDDDYINASFVQPLGTTKRYIATQGPLEATLVDFWTLVWEQNVHVIVMLTKEVEGMHVKCCNYWESAQYGPLVLTLVESSETAEQETRRLGQEGWSWGPSSTSSSDSPSSLPPSTIKRRLQLRHTGYPHAKPRSITQLQYLEWPDLNVPDDPRGILDLVREVGKEAEQAPSSTCMNHLSPHETLDGVDQTTGVAKRTMNNPPVLLHCSAGVGRTGGFIAVDAILDGVRRQIRKKYDHPKKRSMSTPSNSLRTQDKDVVMGEEQAASYNAVHPMQVDEDKFQKPFSGSSVSLPPYTCNEDPMAHMPIVGWRHDTSGKSCSDGFSEYVSEKGSPGPDLSSQGDVDPQGARQKQPQGLAQASPWISPLKDWLNNDDIVPGLEHTTLSILRRSPSSECSSCGDGVLGSRSGSGSTFESGGPSEVNLSAQNEGQSRIRNLMSRSSSSQSGVHQLSSSSSSTRSSSEVPEVWPSTTNREYRVRTSSVPTMSSPLELNPPRPIAIVRSSSFGKHLYDRSHKTSNLHTSSSARLSSPLSSSAQDSTGYSSVFDSTPQTESTGVSSLSSSGTSKSVLDSSNLPSRHGSLQSSSFSEGELDASRQHSRISSSAQTDNPLSQNSLVAVVDNHAQGFDYTDPRALHVEESPVLLSTFDEPVRRILEDMREQRMSLCQSLRQYVFVHRAIIEGALMVADEERARRRQDKDIFQGNAYPSRVRGFGEATSPIQSPFGASPSNRGKRIASPTELVKENTCGERVLSKRHSTKRKQRSDEDAKDDILPSAHPLPPQFSFGSGRSPNLAPPSA